MSEVLEEKLDKEVPQKEDGTAPKYITPLQKVYPSRDGELIRWGKILHVICVSIQFLFQAAVQLLLLSNMCDMLSL